MNANSSSVSKDVLFGFGVASVSFGIVTISASLLIYFMTSLFRLLDIFQGGTTISDAALYVVKPEVPMLYMAVTTAAIVLLSSAPVLFMTQKMFDKQMSERAELVKRSPIGRKIEPMRDRMLKFFLPLRETRVGAISFVVTVILCTTVLLYGLYYLGIPFAPMPLPQYV